MGREGELYICSVCVCVWLCYLLDEVTSLWSEVGRKVESAM